MNVSLNNGLRRTASITISNIDDAFDFSVNKIWFGNKVRLSMGVLLPDGTEFYLPQGVFYFKNPKSIHNPSSRQMTYQLVDKWSYLDGSLFGKIPYSYQINSGTNIFSEITKLLQLSRLDLKSNVTDPSLMIDNITPVFTNYYNSLPNYQHSYVKPNGETVTESIPRILTAYSSTLPVGSSLAEIAIELNNSLVAWIGYDQTGALRIDASQLDIMDSDKPLLYSFTPNNSTFLGTSTATKDNEVYNDILVSGGGLSDIPVWGRVTNIDPASDTNVNMIGCKTFVEEKSEYVSTEQCLSRAKWLLKRKTIVQKSVSIESGQMFHLMENGLISIERIDKPGSPVEKHLIQSFSLPIGETGSMTINATSVNEISDLFVKQASSDDL